MPNKGRRSKNKAVHKKQNRQTAEVSRPKESQATYQLAASPEEIAEDMVCITKVANPNYDENSETEESSVVVAEKTKSPGHSCLKGPVENATGVQMLIAAATIVEESSLEQAYSSKATQEVLSTPSQTVTSDVSAEGKSSRTTRTMTEESSLTGVKPLEEDPATSSQAETSSKKVKKGRKTSSIVVAEREDKISVKTPSKAETSSQGKSKADVENSSEQEIIIIKGVPDELLTSSKKKCARNKSSKATTETSPEEVLPFEADPEQPIEHKISTETDSKKKKASNTKGIKILSVETFLPRPSTGAISKTQSTTETSSRTKSKKKKASTMIEEISSEASTEQLMLVEAAPNESSQDKDSNPVPAAGTQSKGKKGEGSSGASGDGKFQQPSGCKPRFASPSAFQKPLTPRTLETAQRVAAQIRTRVLAEGLEDSIDLEGMGAAALRFARTFENLGLSEEDIQPMLVTMVEARIKMLKENPLDDQDDNSSEPFWIEEERDTPLGLHEHVRNKTKDFLRTNGAFQRKIYLPVVQLNGVIQEYCGYEVPDNRIFKALLDVVLELALNFIVTDAFVEIWAEQMDGGSGSGHSGGASGGPNLT